MTNPDNAFVAKALEGADEKIAEIRKYAGIRKAISEFEVLRRHSKVVEDHRNYLLTFVIALSAKLEKADAQNKELKLRYRSAMKVMEPVRETLQNICDDIEDEGDRAYFGSSNHADDLKRVAQGLDDARWDDVVRPVSEFNGELHPFDVMRDERDKLQSELTSARNALEEERERIAKHIEEQRESGHCGEDTFEIISRQRWNATLKEAAKLIRALPSPQVKG